MLNREWGAESNGKLPHLVIPSKTTILVYKFAVGDLLEFAVKDLLFNDGHVLPSPSVGG